MQSGYGCACDVWPEVLRLLRKQLPGKHYARCLADSAAEQKDGKGAIRCKDEGAARFVAQRLATVVKRTLAAVTGEPAVSRQTRVHRPARHPEA